jgi:Domain of unknown function (DUF1830)/CHAT domain
MSQIINMIQVEYPQIKILFLAADPSDAARLRLGQELRDIREKLQMSKCRDRFFLDSRESVRLGDLTQALLDIEPGIVHFSGHGLNSGHLCFEDKQGRSKTVEPSALADIFKLFSHQIRCVILNACYSEIQAKAIVEHIPFVIGMSKSIEDESAILFSTGFYKALGANREIEDAYDFGRAEIGMSSISSRDIPVLHKKQTCVGSRSIWELTINATFEEVSESEIGKIITVLRQISKDPSIELKRINKGSVKLTFEGSQEGFERIKGLIEKGEIKEVSGFLIQSIEQFNLQREVLRASQTITPMSPEDSIDTDKIVCCYINSTSSIQLVRITDVPNWYFERVAFPGQRLVFESVNGAHLEIHTGMMASLILSDCLPCIELAIAPLEEFPESFARGLGSESNSELASPEREGRGMDLL